MTTHVAFLQHSEWDVPGVLGDRAQALGMTMASFRADQGTGGLPEPGTFDVLVVMGSSESTQFSPAPWIAPERHLVADTVASGVPVLGVCFGGQLLAQVLGATVTRAPRPEIGWCRIDTEDPRVVPAGPWVSWHEDQFDAPPGARVLARSEVSLQAYVHTIHTGLQFHPEVNLEIVGHWVDDAHLHGRLSPGQAEGLLGGFDRAGRGPDDQAHLLFDAFVARAGIPI